MTEFAEGIEPRHFAASEFDRPDLLSPVVLRGLDEIRHRLGFPIGVTSDHRTEDDLVRLYGPYENWPAWLREKGSPHEVRDDGHFHAADVYPAHPGDWTGRKWRYERRWRCGRIFAEAVHLHYEGLWPRLGAELADRHVHLDDDPVLSRPYAWPGKSRG